MPQPDVRTRVGLASVAAWLWLSGCGAGQTPAALAFATTPIAHVQPATLAADGKLHAVGTTTIVADVVREVGGDAVTVTSLLPVGADPHTYEPTPEDLRAIAAAQVVFENGLGLEISLNKVLQAAGQGAVMVSISEGLAPRALGSATLPNETGADPHVWFDPTYVSGWAQNAARTLSALDPPRAANYEANSATYQSQLGILDAWIATQVGTIPQAQREIVTDHDELGYFGARYGVRIVGAVIPSYSSGAEPSAQEISQIETAIRQYGVRAVLVGMSVNPTISRRVTQDTGIRLVPLYAESLSDAGGPAADYLSMMRYDVQAIVEATR